MAKAGRPFQDDETYFGKRARPLDGALATAAPKRRRRPLSATSGELRIEFTPAPGEARREILTLWKRVRPQPRETAKGVGILLIAMGALGLADGASWLGVFVLVLGLMQTFDHLSVLGIERRRRRQGGGPIDARIGPTGVGWTRDAEQHHFGWSMTRVVEMKDGGVLFAFGTCGAMLGIPGRALSPGDLERIEALASAA